MKAFFITPLCGPKTETRNRYNRIIEAMKESAAELHISIESSLGIPDRGILLWNIFSAIDRADIIIADLSDGNPNVYYELSVAHSLNKKYILIFEEGKLPSSDILPFQGYPYDLNNLDAFKSVFSKKFKDTLHTLKPAINPYTQYKAILNNYGMTYSVGLQLFLSDQHDGKVYAYRILKEFYKKHTFKFISMRDKILTKAAHLYPNFSETYHLNVLYESKDELDSIAQSISEIVDNQHSEQCYITLESPEVFEDYKLEYFPEYDGWKPYFWSNDEIANFLHAFEYLNMDIVDDIQKL
jgi:hypothetical protein